MKKKERLIRRVVGADSTSKSNVTARFIGSFFDLKIVFYCLSFVFLQSPLWAISDGQPHHNCKAGLSGDSHEGRNGLEVVSGWHAHQDSNAKSRARYVSEYNSNPSRPTVAEEIPELNTVRVRLKGERFPQPNDGLPPVYVVFFHGAGTGKAGPHSSEQNLIDILSPSPGKKGSTQSRVQALDNYVLMGGEAIALPSSKAGPARSEYTQIEQVAAFINAYVEYLRKELPPGTKIIFDPRSSSPHLIVNAMVKYPGLVDGLHGASSNIGGTRPEDISRIEEGTRALKADLKEQGRENDLDEGGLAWIDSLLAQFDWIDDELIERLPPTLFVSAAKDGQMLPYDRSRQSQLAAKSGGKIKFIDYEEGGHNVLETSPDAIADFFDLVARVRGDSRPQQALARDMTLLHENMHSGVGERGYFGSYPKPTDANLIESIRLGIMYWAQALKIVKDVDEARRVLELHGVAENLIHKPLFIISKHSQLSQIGAVLRKLSWESAQNEAKVRENINYRDDPNYKSPEYFAEEAKKILSSDKSPATMAKIFADPELKIFELGADGNPVYLTPDQIQRIFDPAQVKVAWEKNGALGVLKVPGWTNPKSRGVIKLENAKLRSAYKDGSKNWAKLEVKGFTLKRNQDFWGVLQGLKNQVRKGKTADQNRYSDPEFLKQVQLAYQEGLVDTIEVYDSNGTLVGGSIAFKIGNTYSFDSVFYPVAKTDDLKFVGIDFQRIVLAKTIDILEAEGIPLADVQMVSHLTQQFGAEYIPIREFFRTVFGVDLP